MSIRDKIAAYAAAVGPTASGELRFPITDADALEAALAVTAPRHPQKLAAAITAVQAIPQRPADDAALADWALGRKKAFDALWDALEGEVVDGVTIIRRR